MDWIPTLTDREGPIYQPIVRDGAQPQCGQLFPADRARRLLALEHCVRHFMVAGPASSPTPMHTAIGSARITRHSRLIAHAARCIIITRTGQCAPNRPPATPMPLFEPNSFNGPVEDHRLDEPLLKLSGDAARYNHREGNDDYRQAGDLFRLIGKEAQQRYPSPSGIFWSGYGITHDGNLETQLEKFPQCDSNAPRSRRSPPVRVAQHRPYSQSPNLTESQNPTSCIYLG